MDLDPTYKDHLGDPLLRMTHRLERQRTQDGRFRHRQRRGNRAARWARKRSLGCPGPTAITIRDRYQSTHVQGGTIMGKSPETSVVNTYLQHWQAPNLFVLGASSLPHEGSANPTPTVLALTYRTADAVVDRYLKKPGLLV